MNIYISSDHRGYNLKNLIIPELKKVNINLIDLGPTELNEDDDYTDYAFKLGNKIVEEGTNNIESMGILLCRSGIGMSIAANKVKGIYAALCTNISQAKLSRLDNNANVLVLDSEMFDTDLNGLNEVLSIVTEFINTKFSNEERHLRRVNKIREYEESN